MAEVRLTALRIGFPYVAELDFPSGFLAAGESVRGTLTRFHGDPTAVLFASDRVGDVVTWELTEAQTAGLVPGSYVVEAEVFETATPLIKGVPLTSNRYILDCDYVPGAA